MNLDDYRRASRLARNMNSVVADVQAVAALVRITALLWMGLDGTRNCIIIITSACTGLFKMHLR
jgi:hypothetical protein